MPWNGPHRGAPCLWAWSDEENWEYEFSAASSTLDKREIQGLEAMLFWKYRTEAKKSAICNHGKFHENYQRPKDRKWGPENQGKTARGARLPEGQKNPKGGPCWPVLRLDGNPIDSNWMGLDWTEAMHLVGGTNIENHPAVYKIWQDDEEGLEYIGQTTVSKSRLVTHSKKSWITSNSLFSVCFLPEDIRDYQLHEIEDDLLGAYYSETNSIPTYQFAGVN